jgi:hypothetical protein
MLPLLAARMLSHSIEKRVGVGEMWEASEDFNRSVIIVVLGLSAWFDGLPDLNVNVEGAMGCTVHKQHRK